MRTVRRWEREEGLPVHRHHHKTLGSVYALTDEVDAWRESRRAREGRILRARQEREAPPRRTMIAVLPFEERTADSEQAYLGEGITDEMIARLGRMRPASLGVIARTTIMQYRGAAKTIRQIGEELGVHYVLEGAVRHESGRVRVNVQLVQVADQSQIWAGQYDRSLSSILALQVELASQIDREIRSTLAPASLFGSPARGVRPEAYLAWLKGLHFLNRFTPASVRRSVEYFKEAVALDPEFASAHASLAQAYVHVTIWGELPSGETLPLATAAARAALDLDPGQADAYASLGLIDANYQWDFPAAERHFERALQMNPSCVPAGQWYAEFLGEMGRAARALELLENARTHDPLAPGLYASAAFVLWLDRQYDAALQQTTEALDIAADYPMALIRRGVTLAAIGRHEDAVAALQAASKSAPELLACRSLLGYACGRAGRTGEARSVLQALHDEARRRYVPPFLFSNVYLGLGDRDAALGYIEQEWEARGWYLLLLNRSSVYDDALRAHPRFQDLIRRMNFPPAR